MISEEINREFSELVAFCRKLLAAKRVASGYKFVIRDNRLSLDSIGPHGPSSENFSLEESAKNIRGQIQYIRHTLSQWFNQDSNRWNASNIGKMLKSIETEFREQTYHVEQGETYNSFTMFFLVKELAELGRYMLSPAFTRYRWHMSRLRALNRYAAAYFERRQRRSVFQTTGMMVEMMVAIDDLRHERGSDDAVDGLIIKMVGLNLLPQLKNIYKDV